MDDGKQLKYAHIRGGNEGYEHTLAASQVIVDASGKFVKRTGASTDTVTMADDTDGELLGWLECEAISSAAGTEKRKVINDLTAVFRLPINSGTYAHVMIGKSCDLAISSNIQGVQLDASDEDTLIIVGGDVTNQNWVDVMLNPTKMAATGVV